MLTMTSAAPATTTKRPVPAEPLTGAAFTKLDRTALAAWAKTRGLIVAIAVDHQNFPELAEVYSKRGRVPAIYRSPLDRDPLEMRWAIYRSAASGDVVIDDMRTGKEVSRSNSMPTALAKLKRPPEGYRDR